MNTRTLFPLLALSLTLPGISLADDQPRHAQSAEKSPADMHAAVTHFVAIGDALAADSTKAVSEHAGELKKMAIGGKSAEHRDKHAEASEKHHAGRMASTHGVMAPALDVLAASDVSLKDAREAYKSLSETFIPMAQTHPKMAVGGPHWVVMTCPMAKAQWIQRAGDTANPYYGSDMASCGSKVSDLGTPPPSAPAD